jgi:hypothetical protein
MNKLNRIAWLNKRLVEQDIPAMGGQPDMGAGQAPMSSPGGPGDPMGDNPPPMPPTNMATDPLAGMEDIGDDPQYPEMPEERGGDEDFQIWKMNYVQESIKGDPNNLINMLMQIRERELEEPERKFVEDNLQVQFLRQNSNVFEASTELRKLIKQRLDHTNPARSTVNHIFEVMQKYPMLNEIYIKCGGLLGGKQDAHRKFIAAMLGAVQLSTGSKSPDLVFEEKDYSIRISTRYNSRWGDVHIGTWMLQDDDPQRYLKGAELERLDGGSPEEKDVLRRRVIIESIASYYKDRSFIVNVVGTDGTVYHLGWDLGESLKSAFLDGKLVVRTHEDVSREAFINKDGTVVSIPRMSMYYVRESGEFTGRGLPETEEVEFIEHRNGSLYLTAQLDLLKEAAMTMQGLIVQESPWQGNPTDIFRISRCVPSVSEQILRQC